MSKLVYISHPISGDVEKNVREVLEICKKIYTKDIIPFAPYLVSLQYLDDKVTQDRELGIAASIETLKRGLVDELWAFGDTISAGMKEEIRIAEEKGIPVIYKKV
ncbi:MAG: DUF4406 domain-containing protein [Patescibacteria group bacterium]